LSYTRTRKLRTFSKRNRMSMPCVINTAATSRAGIGITSFFTAITRVVSLRIHLSHALALNVTIKINIDKYNRNKLIIVTHYISFKIRSIILIAK